MGIHDGHRQRKRQQFLNHGTDAMADHEVLELLLFYAIPRQDTNPIAHALLQRFGSLEKVLAAPPAELQQVPGIGESAAALLKLVPQMMRRAKLSAGEREIILDTSDRLGTYVMDLFVAQSQEVMYQLCLDAKGRLLSCREICRGDVASVSLNMRQIVENALHSSAVLVALAHNHPSGLAIPSHEDRIATMQIKEALGTVGIRLVDHIVAADDDYVSFLQEGLL